VYDRAVDGSTIRLAVSRDGHAFRFVPGQPLIGGPGSSDEKAGFLSAEPTFVRTPDDRMLIFYNVYRLPHKFPRHRFYAKTQYAGVWRADRLAALCAPQRGQFTTAAMILRGSQIVLNMDAHRTGGIEVEIRDEQFRPVPGYSFAEADTLQSDQLRIPVTWKQNSDLRALKGRKIYLRFRMRAARLYSIAATDR
jgi:hypothetical protein